MRRRYFIYLSYDGARYHGWQIQPNGITVQQVLQEALSTLLRRPTPVVGAGRTDTGVHARLLVAHFDYESEAGDGPDTAQLTYKLNRLLPPDVAVHRVVPVVPDAHARFSATSRTYYYFVHVGKDPFARTTSYRLYAEPDFAAMNRAAAVLPEYTDFTSFSKVNTDTKTNNCRITKAEWRPVGEGRWRFEIQADRFLRNMVRAVVGTLLEVGRGKLTLEGFRRVIERKNRCDAGDSVPGHALFLVDVTYPETCFPAEAAGDATPL